jgi:hypothetical protein
MRLRKGPPSSRRSPPIFQMRTKPPRRDCSKSPRRRDWEKSPPNLQRGYS